MPIGAIAERHGVAVSSLSSLWMPFVLHSVSFLKPGGRLGLVLPAELLTVNYAAPLRSFLMASFSSVRLATFDEPVFPEVQEEVVLLLADGWRGRVMLVYYLAAVRRYCRSCVGQASALPAPFGRRALVGAFRLE